MNHLRLATASSNHEGSEPNQITVNRTVWNWNRRNRRLKLNRRNRNRAEPEPEEPDFGVEKIKIEWRGPLGVVFLFFAASCMILLVIQLGMMLKRLTISTSRTLAYSR